MLDRADASARLFETGGICLSAGPQSPEKVFAQWDAVSDIGNPQQLESAGKQTEKFLVKAMSHMQAQSQCPAIWQSWTRNGEAEMKQAVIVSVARLKSPAGTAIILV